MKVIIDASIHEYLYRYNKNAGILVGRPLPKPKNKSHSPYALLGIYLTSANIAKPPFKLHASCGANSGQLLTLAKFDILAPFLPGFAFKVDIHHQSTIRVVVNRRAQY